MTGSVRPAGSERVAAVVVTYNRCDLLAEVLTAVQGQSRAVDRVIVVDNGSTDHTIDTIRERFPTVELIDLHRNTGGAGGFALGLRAALTGLGADLVWMLDDDAVPDADALAALVEARTGYGGPRPPAAVASRVVWVDGRIHRMNVPRRRRAAPAEEARRAAAVGCTPMRTSSFCSVLLDGRAAREEALPVADYFLWNDDFEYTARLLRRRIGLYCPASRVVHKTATYYSSGSAPGDRFYYDVRNMVWMLTRSQALAPYERVLFAGVTLRRWVRTVYRAHDRPYLLRTFLRAVVHAGTRGPRPTSRVLAEVGPPPA